MNMGDLRVCSLWPHGVLLGEDCSRSRLSTLSFPTLNPDPSLVTADNWARAENITCDILCRIRPTLDAERRREEVIDFVQGLITTRTGCEVFPYGSVPLKTYLPDGDVDLTVICCPDVENAVVSDVHAVLKGQENNGVSQYEYEVKDVYCIDAEVKLVKCIVQNIVVDISFNQLGGLCTLCFLEQVDRLVGKNHLFKRSIILIKAWCYYESRILGAHHGLISTYALEILVLYIFHLFHESLHSPLAVLHRFLEYFSKFDWENHCISLRGPVSKSSLLDIVAETPENSDRELLLGEDFLRKCMNLFSVSSKPPEPNLRVFPLKHLNIIDPLKENNNLGRSVNRGNFYRIRSAFKYGARKLGWILLLPEERIETELNKFFANTLDRHYCTNAQFPAHDTHFGASVHSSAPLETCFEAKVSIESTLGFRDEKFLGTEASLSKVRCTGSRLTERMQKLDTAVNVNTSSTYDIPYLSPLYVDHSNVVLKNAYSAPQEGPTNGLMASEYVLKDETRFTLKADLKGEPLASNLHCLYNDHKIGLECSRSASRVSEDLSCGLNKRCNSDTRSFDVGKLLDLCGDYDSYIRNLRYGQICDSFVMSPTLPFSPPMSVHIQKEYRWAAIHRSLLHNHNVPSRIDRKWFTKVRQLKPVNHFPLVSEGKKKPQGIGTYFPKTNTRSYIDMQSQEKEKTRGRMVQSQLQNNDHNNELSTTSQEQSSLEGSHVFLDDEFPVLGNGKLGSLDSPPSSNLLKWRTHGNGLSWPHKEPEFWPIYRDEPWDASATIPKKSNQLQQDTSDLLVSESDVENLNLVEERDTEEFYYLKNDEDFPPLSH